MAPVRKTLDRRAPHTGNGKPAERRPLTELMDRQPPFDLRAEQGLIGSVILLPEVLDEVLLITKADDFYDDAHRRLFGHLQHLYDNGRRIDDTLLVNRLKTAGDLEAIGGVAYLSRLVNETPNAAHAAYYAEVVRDKALARRVIFEATVLLRDAYDEGTPPGELAPALEAAAARISDANLTGNETKSFDRLVIEGMEHLERRIAGGVIQGLPTGLEALDAKLCGLKPSSFVIVAGRPSMGKTALATTIARNVAKAGGCIYFASLEMTALELVERMLAAESHVNGHRMARGTVSQEDRLHLVNAASHMATWALHVDDNPARTVAEISASARRLKRKATRLDLVVLDYLQLITPDNPRDERVIQLGKISRGIKRLARELQAPVLCLAQVNREAEKNAGHRPRLSNLREAGDLEQDADAVVFVHRPCYYEKPEYPTASETAILDVAKHRNGPTGEGEVLWFEQWMAFENKADDRHEPQQEF